jgi:hypothetical protein
MSWPRTLFWAFAPGITLVLLFNFAGDRMDEYFMIALVVLWVVLSSPITWIVLFLVFAILPWSHTE